ncbi:MAG TPA: hypothetical protein VM577_14570 [Anaerovoracaceae bacterium]|nr:hypothetical protein [Anaerovoracaceae bacterium]
MERKASDVLLELEKKVDQILQYLKNIDFNNKLILERLNKAPVESAKPIAAAPPPAPQRKMPSAGPYVPPTPPTAVAPAGKAPAGKTLMTKPVTDYEFHEVLDDGENHQIHEDLQPKLGRRDIRTPMQQDKKTQVQQKIMYPDGKNVILASVEIFTLIPDGKGKLEKKLVKQTRTNSSGKWLAALDPGKYSIHIFKTATTNKPVVEQAYEVEIPLSDAPLELEPSQV